jgi:hypothetical protein
MKVLIWYMNSFEYKTSVKSLYNVEEITETKKVENSLVAFIHVEEKDAENSNSVETKLIKQLKWAAKKNGTDKIVLHSFAHLSKSKGSPEEVKKLFMSAEERLRNSGYEVFQTPFGYFLDLQINAPGFSLARIFKEF